jgi:hypothetical protein
MVMQKVGSCLAMLWLLVLAPASPAGAETGPCVADPAGVMTCGEGPGAARVVDGTTSPSKRLAFAWRVPGRPPTEPPPEGKGDSLLIVESVLIRLADGAVLSSAKGEYWRTGDARANHIDEAVAWSPNSRLAIETQDSKWSTDIVRLYAIGADDKALVLDLQKVIEPAVRTQLRQLGKKDRIYTFSIEDGPTIDDSGAVRLTALMQIPKQDGDLTFDVTLKVSQKNGALSAGDVSVRRSRAKS